MVSFINGSSITRQTCFVAVNSQAFLPRQEGLFLIDLIIFLM